MIVNILAFRFTEAERKWYSGCCIRILPPSSLLHEQRFGKSSTHATTNVNVFFRPAQWIFWLRHLWHERPYWRHEPPLALLTFSQSFLDVDFIITRLLAGSPGNL
ncbi:hypothetical protein LOAG_12526 [Loa loa]|uniref:Uncharacterized protein n=1 Tax=Loa loa TaxID=7209 RepID=A0A1S0TL55_LOALO|nr:hypothetical protein LOAG_12526 [Loa loa]EFO15982.2 hypothetical protein LOAG_12526 [Loa loa]